MTGHGEQSELVGYIDAARKRIRLTILDLSIMTDAAAEDMVITERELSRALHRLFEAERGLRVALDLAKQGEHEDTRAQGTAIIRSILDDQEGGAP